MQLLDELRQQVEAQRGASPIATWRNRESLKIHETLQKCLKVRMSGCVNHSGAPFRLPSNLAHLFSCRTNPRNTPKVTSSRGHGMHRRSFSHFLYECLVPPFAGGVGLEGAEVDGCQGHRSRGRKRKVQTFCNYQIALPRDKICRCEGRLWI